MFFTVRNAQTVSSVFTPNRKSRKHRGLFFLCLSCFIRRLNFLVQCRRPDRSAAAIYFYCSNFKSGQVSLIQMKLKITNLPQRALQSELHTKPSIIKYHFKKKEFQEEQDMIDPLSEQTCMPYLSCVNRRQFPFTCFYV